MLIRLLLIFSIIPLVELALLIKVGGYVGVLWTIILVAGTGMFGITLARSQGFQLINEIKSTLNRGEIPADHLIQGLLILIGAVMLLTPGLLTDTTGFLLIIPITRRFFATYVKKIAQKWINKGSFNISYSGFNQNQNQDSEPTSFRENDEDSIEVDFEDIKIKKSLMVKLFWVFFTINDFFMISFLEELRNQKFYFFRSKFAKNEFKTTRFDGSILGNKMSVHGIIS